MRPNIEQHFNEAIIQRDSYLNSFLYYLVTGRKGSWIHKSDKSFTVVSQHPHKTDTLLVFPEVGEADYNLTACVLQQLYKSGHKIQLARYTVGDLDKLRGALSLMDVNIVNVIEPIEEDSLDWRYPVHILDTEKVGKMDGPVFNRIRAKHKKAAQQVNYAPLNRKTAIKDMRAALKYWEGSMIAAGKDTDDMSEFYEEFFSILGNYNGQYDGFIYFKGRRPLGFSVWDQVSDSQANSFINLADISIAGLSDFQTVTVCRHLHEKGVRYLNIGGSETASLNEFKVKYDPHDSIDLYSADVHYHDFKPHAGITMSKFI